MANIANPLTATKIDGSTFTAAECNTVGSDFTRCVVNDGQTDLVATSSLNGGTTKSWSAFGMVNLSTTCSGTRTETCGTYTVASAGNVTIGAAGSGTLTVQTTGTGSVVVDSVDDVTINADNDVSINPTGNLVTPAGQLSLTGTGWPALGSRSVTQWQPPYAFACKPTTGFEPDISAALAGHALQQLSTGAMAAFYLAVPAGYSIVSASVAVQSVGSPAAGLPTAMPVLKLFVINAAGTSVTQLGSTASDASGSAAAYANLHDITVTPASPYAVAAGERVFLHLEGAFHASDPQRFVYVRPPKLSVTITSLRLA